ncbi:hypothetical protein TRAPUB_10647 [Trametes pubescens]|uniref:Uncharacterized protein n=1 Tax=Trametes pubescens TaxID=154538 RepID=A0A1M2VZ72_TRAPU|nr:hypothetical protein TRAPUB_10647 [Trametes pubescens]
MSTLARQYNLDGHYGAFQPLAEDESTHTWPPVAEAFPAAQPEEEDDDIDLYYFSTDSDSSMGDISGEASVHDNVEVEEEIMPGGWPAAIESRISSPTPWKPSLVRPQSIIVDGLRITVTLPEDESCDYEDGHCLVGSDSAASFFTAAESIIDDIHLLSASPTSDFLHVPIPVLAPSPSVLFILEEFACSPPLPALSFDDDGEANLMAMSSSPSVGLLKPTKNDLLVPGVVPSPEFASNFAQARFPELVCPSFLAPIPASPSHYPWFDSLLDQYLSDEEFADGPVQDEAYQFYGASTQVHGDEQVPDYNAIVTSDSQESPRVSFEDLWQGVRAGTFTEAQPAPGPRAWPQCGPALEVDFGEACAKICATVSAYDLLGLYTPSEPEPMSVLPPAYLAEGALLCAEDEEYYRTPSAIDLTGAGPHPDERLAKAARETFWQMWTRPSGEDLALFFKRNSDAPSGLHIFVEENAHRTPLPGSKNDSRLIQPLDRPFGAREQVKQEHRDAFLELWKESLKQAYL